jgi:hypothetical protein
MEIGRWLRISSTQISKQRLSKQPPSGEGWVHEVKHDSYRLQVHVRLVQILFVFWNAPAACNVRQSGQAMGGGISGRLDTPAKWPILSVARPCVPLVSIARAPAGNLQLRFAV